MNLQPSTCNLQPSARQRILTDPDGKPMKVDTFTPTVCLRGAKHLLGLNEDYILDLITDHHLSFAWDIGLGEERREVRILSASIDHYKLHGSKPHALTDDQAFDLLLPPGFNQPLRPSRPLREASRTWLTNGELQLILNCVSDHVLHLVDSKDLKLQPHTDYKRGPNGSALVTVASFKSFFEKRRLP